MTKKISKKAYKLLGHKAQIILLHGYTGSPYDLRPLADHLHAADYNVQVPLLLGHGTQVDDLLNVTAKDWLVQVNKILVSLDKTKPIIVGGLSMGALLAMLVTAQHKQIKGLLLISPALYLDMMGELTLAAAHLGMMDHNWSLPKLSGGSDILDPEAKKLTPAYKEMPIHGLMEFDTIRRQALLAIPKINCPVFMGFGEQDAAINIKRSHMALLKSLHVPLQSRFYKNSKHVVTLDYDKAVLANDIVTFFNRYLGI